MKNSNNTLPLSKDKIRKIAVIGPNADNWESLVGNYHGTPKNPVTFLEGIKNKVEPEIEVLYAEGSHLDHETLNLKPVPSVYLQTEDGRQGLVGRYFNNTHFTGEPVLIRVDDKVDFSWQYAPISKELVDTFSVRWTGFLVPPADGVYELGVFSKRGMAISIEGKEITNGRGSIHHPKYKTDRLALKGGKKYPIEITYFSDESNAQASLLWAMPEKNLMDEAVKITEQADMAVVVLGLSQRLEGEGGDRDDIALPKEQEALLKAIKATGKPVIMVINAGSALAINWAKENIDAIVNVGYPGEEGGNALADVLWGDYNPAGRLPITYYKSLDELPDFQNYDMKGRTYRYYKGEPLYPFGYGLSYTTFKYSDLTLPETVKAGDDVKVSVTVTNTGNSDGDEVVQLYLTDKKASTPRPIRQLEGFERIFLKAGESKLVEFNLNPRQLSLINKQEIRVIEEGTFDVFVGGEQPGFSGDLDAGSTEVITGSFKIIGNLKFDIK